MQSPFKIYNDIAFELKYTTLNIPTEKLINLLAANLNLVPNSVQNLKPLFVTFPSENKQRSNQI